MQVMTMDKLDIEIVKPEALRPLRQRLLRPGQPFEAMVYPGDDAAETLHLAAVDPSGQVLGIASFYIEPHPHRPEPGDWRLRGMAVDPISRGKGLGGRILQTGLDHIRQQAGQRLWCNARVAAQGFYEKLGFAAEGEVFEIDPIGPHVVMWIDLT